MRTDGETAKLIAKFLLNFSVWTTARSPLNISLSMIKQKKLILTTFWISCKPATRCWNSPLEVLGYFIVHLHPLGSGLLYTDTLFFCSSLRFLLSSGDIEFCGLKRLLHVRVALILNLHSTDLSLTPSPFSPEALPFQSSPLVCNLHCLVLVGRFVGPFGCYARLLHTNQYKFKQNIPLSTYLI